MVGGEGNPQGSGEGGRSSLKLGPATWVPLGAAMAVMVAITGGVVAFNNFMSSVQYELRDASRERASMASSIERLAVTFEDGTKDRLYRSEFVWWLTQLREAAAEAHEVPSLPPSPVIPK